ncbi:MAG: T9SS type A sorting domain-containing protein [Bacteroidota bacterium]
MKTLFTRLRSTLERCALLLLLFGSNLPFAAACIEPDTIPTVTVNYSPDFTQIEIRIGNLNLHTESPNVFCSCALSSYAGVFTNVKYIAFVKTADSSFVSYPNFSPWAENVVASVAWNNEFSSYPNWTGYVAEVINAGLNTEDAVDMVIRAEMPPGAIPNVVALDSAIAVSWLATDMWLPDQQTMAFDHTGLRNLRFENSGYFLQQMPQEYFDYLDELLSGTSEPGKLLFELRLSPNPAQEFLTANYVLTGLSKVKASILDLSGKLIWEDWKGEQPGGEQTIEVELTAILPKTGVYLFVLDVDGKRQTLQFVQL